MNIISASKQELIDNLKKMLVTPNLRQHEHTREDEAKYAVFLNDVKKDTKNRFVVLPLDFAIRDEMFNLIKEQKVFVESSIKFKTTFSMKRPATVAYHGFDARYRGHEFEYSFLDNHPGIINVDKLKDIPIDYEGLMAVPPTILEYKNLSRFNIHRVLYTPVYNGKAIYPRIVISNKIIVTD